MTDPAEGDVRLPARFVMVRDEDVSGVSGTGIVATGVVFGDGTTVVRWLGEHCSTAVWPDAESVAAVHGHDGRTRLVFVDEQEGQEGRADG